MRFDLFIAVCALLISAVAAGASAYQTYVIRQQFSATVWPYLSDTVTFGAESLEIDLRNDGIGPALIRSATLTRDGRIVTAPAGSSNNALDVALAPELRAARLDAMRSGSHRPVSMSTSSINPGSVLPAGAHWQILRADGPFLTQRLQAAAQRIDLTICYCSLLGRCWIEDFKNSTDQPRDTRDCPHP